MSIHDSIRTAIGSLVAGRYYPGKFPQEPGAPTWPAIRGTVVGRDNAPDQCGAGDLDEDDLRIQLDVCATTYDLADALFTSVCAAVANMNPPLLRRPGAFDTWDADARVHRFSADFLIQQSTPE